MDEIMPKKIFLLPTTNFINVLEQKREKICIKKIFFYKSFISQFDINYNKSKR